jgi:hypothetical protein
MRIRISVAGIGLFVVLYATLTAHPAFAANEIQPGLWQDTEISTVSGKSEPPKVTTNCVAAEDAQDPVKLIKDGMKDQAGQCSKFNVQTSGNVILFEMNCGDPKQGAIEMTMTYTVHSPQHTSSSAKSTMSMMGQKIVSNLTTESKWLAAVCKK